MQSIASLVVSVLTCSSSDIIELCFTVFFKFPRAVLGLTQYSLLGNVIHSVGAGPRRAGLPGISPAGGCVPISLFQFDMDDANSWYHPQKFSQGLLLE